MHKVKEIFLEILAASNLFKTTVLEVISVHHSLFRFKSVKIRVDGDSYI